MGQGGTDCSRKGVQTSIQDILNVRGGDLKMENKSLTMDNWREERMIEERKTFPDGRTNARI